jgi:hypothetical protein
MVILLGAFVGIALVVAHMTGWPLLVKGHRRYHRETGGGLGVGRLWQS